MRTQVAPAALHGDGSPLGGISALDDTTTRAELAHYRASLEMLRGVAEDSALVDLLDAELNRLSRRKPVTGTRADGATTGIARAKRSKPPARAI